MEFRKKPVSINAWKVAELLLAFEKNWKDLPKEVIDAYEVGTLVPCPNELYINTLEGKMQANKTDWLIKGVKGEFYPCKPDIFAMTYEESPDVHQ